MFSIKSLSFGKIPIYRQDLWGILKVSKSRKQNTKLSHTPKTNKILYILLPQPLKVVELKKIKALYCVEQPLITNSNHQVLLFLVSTTFQRLGQTNVQNFVGFLEYGRTLYFAFEIYCPLSANLFWTLRNSFFLKLQFQLPNTGYPISMAIQKCFYLGSILMNVYRMI